MSKFKLFLIFFLLIAIGFGYYFMFGTYSEGYRSGTITKFSRKGFVFKTYEGELNQGMIIVENAAANYGSAIFLFTVPSENKEIIEKMEKAMLTGSRAKLFYKERFFKLPWVGDTKYLILGIELLEN